MVERNGGLDFFTAIRRRRSIREFTGEKIPDEDIERIIDTARYAPSPENFQNVRYILIRKDEDLKKTIADICQEASSELFGSAPYELTQGRLWYMPESRRPATFKEMRDGSLFREIRFLDSFMRFRILPRLTLDISQRVLRLSHPWNGYTEHVDSSEHTGIRCWISSVPCNGA